MKEKCYSLINNYIYNVKEERAYFTLIEYSNRVCDAETIDELEQIYLELEEIVDYLK